MKKTTIMITLTASLMLAATPVLASVASMEEADENMIAGALHAASGAIEDLGLRAAQDMIAADSGQEQSLIEGIAQIAASLTLDGAQASEAETVDIVSLDDIGISVRAWDYAMIHQALLFAAQIRNLDVEWYGKIEMDCEMCGF